jgi:hypothetical protein
MTGPAPAPIGQPARDDLTHRVFRALYPGYELHTVKDTTYVAVPRGTAWHAGRSISEVARHISDPGDPGLALAAFRTPASVPLSRRPVHVAATAAPAASPAVRARITPYPREDVMMLTPAQLAAITELADQWSFLWDKRRQLWIAAQDSPDGEQFDEADLDTLLTLIGQLPG